MMRSRPLRAQLRFRALAGVLAIILVVLAVFDIVAVTVLRHYLLSQTDSTLQTVSNLARPRLAEVLALDNANHAPPPATGSTPAPTATTTLTTTTPPTTPPTTPLTTPPTTTSRVPELLGPGTAGSSAPGSWSASGSWSTAPPSVGTGRSLPPGYTFLPAHQDTPAPSAGGVQVQSVLGAYLAYYIAFVPAGGSAVTVQSGSDLAPRLPPDLPALAAAGGTETVIGVDGHSDLRIRAERVPSGTLVVSANLDQVDRTVGQVRLIVLIGSAVTIALIGAGVFLLLRRGLRPIEAMAAKADRITAGDLADRVGPHEPGSEVGRLGAALNGMLERIAAGIAQQEADQATMRRFFADASHELRTPLASLRANAELYQQGAVRGPAEVDEVMRRIGLEANRMSGLVDDMLRLARLEQRPDQQREPVDLTALVGGCVAAARIAEPARVWRTEIAEELVTIGDEELLRRAVDNLLGNVRVHTPADTVATLTAAIRDGVITIEVTDDGPGVPVDRLPRIFDRFYRAENAPRSGSGLGLAIVREVATAHDGSVRASTVDPHGLRVTLTLPLGTR